MKAQKLVKAFEKVGNLLVDVDFFPLTIGLGVLYLLTLPLWLPLYVITVFVAELSN